MTATAPETGTPSTLLRTWRRPQVGLHATVLLMLFLSIVPIYLMLTVSFKNPIQYQHEHWNVSLPLRVRNYVAAWDMSGQDRYDYIG